MPEIETNKSTEPNGCLEYFSYLLTTWRSVSQQQDGFGSFENSPHRVERASISNALLNKMNLDEDHDLVPLLQAGSFDKKIEFQYFNLGTKITIDFSKEIIVIQIKNRAGIQNDPATVESINTVFSDYPTLSQKSFTVN